MRLNNYLKQFNNICWYPSAYKDTIALVALSYKSLGRYGISRNDAPDCFIFTDYDGHNSNVMPFIEDINQNVESYGYDDEEFKVALFNGQELPRIHVGFDIEMVDFNKDDNYQRVFVYDALIEHKDLGRWITKFIYVIVENTKFAFEFLLENEINVKYVIHSRYGHGFGGGRSNGAFLCQILKDLGTKYFISDMDNSYPNDVADIYLNKEQADLLPVLKKIDSFYYRYSWKGHESTILYEVVGYKHNCPEYFTYRYVLERSDINELS